MTAPDVNADVRARFEAWVQGTRGWAACKARNKPMYLRQTSDGNYCDYRVNDRWMAYRAAHADLSGEVRELVEEVREIADDLREWGSTDAQLATRSKRLDAALAKFHPTKEKP